MVKSVGVILCLASLAWAQRFSNPQWQAIYEKAQEALRDKPPRPQDALPLYTQIINAHTGLTSLRYERAQILKQMKKMDEAVEEFKAIVEENVSHILSSKEIALILMQRPNRTSADREEARRRLIDAARYGYDAVGLIESEEAFKEFRTDVPFILDLINAPSDRERGGSKIEIDPFKRLVDRAGVVEPIDPKRTEDSTKVETEEPKRYLERIINMLTLVLDRLDWKDEEAADEIFTDVEALVQKVETITAPELEGLRREALDLYGKVLEQIKIVRLKRYERIAQAIVNEMKKHIELSQFNLVENDFQALQNHLSSAPDDDLIFSQVADEWMAQGQKWLKVARRLKEAASIAIHLSAVVYGEDRGRPVAQAIVNDHIVKRNDIVLDASGTPIPKLTVKEIGRNWVKFHYQGVEFNWYMKLEKPIGFVYVGED